MRVGVVGGGFTGMVLAYRLAERGHAVTVLERDRQLGGLATHHDYGPFVWDRFYHCILPSDSHLIRVLKDIGLAGDLRWRRTLTGFYVDHRLHSISSAFEFLRFPLVGPWGKLRLVLTLLHCSRLDDWQSLETVTVEEWLIRRCGRATYEKLWRPLLLAKLGESYRRVSAVFIWSYIKRLFMARDASAKREHLGYVSGGYRAVFARLEALIRRSGGTVRTGVTVKRVTAAEGRGVGIETDGERLDFDKVVFTSPVNVLQAAASPELVDVSDGGATVEYLGVVCGVLVTRRPLVPYYVVNIADARIPFTGVIGMSNLVGGEELGGYHITYLPKYVLSTDPFLRLPDREVERIFWDGLRRMFPALTSADVHGLHINRASKVQPLQVLRYSSLVPRVTTLHPDFFVLNTAQFVNATLNNNEVARAVEEFLATHHDALTDGGTGRVPIDHLRGVVAAPRGAS
jgi:protoporphyrinogen oxidase